MEQDQAKMLKEIGDLEMLILFKLIFLKLFLGSQLILVSSNKKEFSLRIKSMISD